MEKQVDFAAIVATLRIRVISQRSGEFIDVQFSLATVLARLTRAGLGLRKFSAIRRKVIGLARFGAAGPQPCRLGSRKAKK